MQTVLGVQELQTPKFCGVLLLGKLNASSSVSRINRSNRSNTYFILFLLGIKGFIKQSLKITSKSFLSCYFLVLQAC